MVALAITGDYLDGKRGLTTLIALQPRTALSIPYHAVGAARWLAE